MGAGPRLPPLLGPVPSHLAPTVPWRPQEVSWCGRGPSCLAEGLAAPFSRRGQGAGFRSPPTWDPVKILSLSSWLAPYGRGMGHGGVIDLGTSVPGESSASTRGEGTFPESRSQVTGGSGLEKEAHMSSQEVRWPVAARERLSCMSLCVPASGTVSAQLLCAGHWGCGAEAGGRQAGPGTVPAACRLAPASSPAPSVLRGILKWSPPLFLLAQGEDL